MKGIRWWIKVMGVIAFFVAQSAHAQHILQLQNGQDKVRINTQLKAYQEQDRPLSLPEVIALQREFNYPPNSNPNYGFDQRAIWLHLMLSNVSDTKDWVIDVGFAQNDRVDIYLLQEGEIIAQTSQGKVMHKQLLRFPTLEAELPYAEPVELYIRVSSANASRIAPVDIQTKSAHTQYVLIDNLLWGCFYGGLVILAIYNLVLYSGTREVSVLAYVVYLSTVILWQLIWGGHAQLLTDSGFGDWLNQHTDLIFVVIGLGSGLFTLLFLEAWRTAPKTHKVILVNMSLLGVLGLLSTFNILNPLHQNILVYGVSILAITSYLYAGFESYMNRFRPARYFIFAWSILAASALTGMFSIVGLLPSNAITTYCFQFGVFLESALFSLALMEKVNHKLEEEVREATEELRNNMEYIEEQNARLDIARKHAIRASKVKSQFLANMSHEIRTPLNAIIGFSKELTHLPLPKEKSQHVGVINSSAENLLNIVNDVLDFSKIEAGKLELNNEPFSPCQMVEEVSSMMAKQAQQKGVEFVLELEPLPDNLIGDAARLRQILINLLGNAVKFTHSGHVSLNVSGDENANGVYQLHLNVEDTGIGIEDKDKPKLFHAFSQVDDALTRMYRGTGLGLVISQELVKLMNGNIDMESTPGIGSCFRVTVRLHRLSYKSCLSPSEEWRDKKVVILDPYPFARRAASNLLKHLGADVYSLERLAVLPQLCDNPDTLVLSCDEATADQLAEHESLLNRYAKCKFILLYQDEDMLQSFTQLLPHGAVQLPKPMLPSHLDQLDEMQEEDDHSFLHDKLKQLPKVKVLAVDDMEINLRLLSTWFHDSNVDLLLCDSGQKAVDLCQKQAFDLILMDVQMPQMDGLQATQLIRKTEENIGTPIIAVTAHAFREERERLLSSGMDDFLPKPIDLQDLLGKIIEWCQLDDEEDEPIASFDWQMALKRAHNNQGAARDLLETFERQLPALVKTIDNHWQQRELQALKDAVHKLHGACCYTGVPKLQSICYNLETRLKLDIDDVDNLVTALLQESTKVLDILENMLSIKNASSG